jgi:hypothetical protein
MDSEDSEEFRSLFETLIWDNRYLIVSVVVLAAVVLILETQRPTEKPCNCQDKEIDADISEPGNGSTDQPGSATSDSQSISG